jgi:heme-degrading monooxygenase HmoA
MPYGINVQLKVEDYAKWKAEFDEFAAARKAGGEKSYQIYRLVDDPNTLVLLMEYDSLDNMRKWAQSEELREAMQRAGVTDPGDSYELEELEKGSV